jgi:excisionase family DNA binding protein
MLSLPVNSSLPEAELSSSSLITVKETALYLRIPVPTVYYLVQRKKLPAVRIGGRWRIKKDLLDASILKNQDFSPAPLFEKPPILIIDDEVPICQVLTLAMSNQGYSSHICHTGAEAMAKLGENTYQIVFLDIRLPDMDGEQLFERISHLPNPPHVVLMTGFPLAPVLENVLIKNPVTLLQKPLQLDQVMRITDLLLAKIR